MFRSALTSERGFNRYGMVGLILEPLAWVAAADGQHQQAGRLLGTARSLWQDMGTTISTFGPHMAEQHDQCERDVVRGLGETAYEALLTQEAGHRTPAEVITYALSIEPEPPAANPLTRREQQVAALVAEGMSNRQIATALQRSPRTVDTHIENILAKLDFGSRARIASWWTANQASAV